MASSLSYLLKASLLDLAILLTHQIILLSNPFLMAAPTDCASEMILVNAWMICVCVIIKFLILIDSPHVLAINHIAWSIICKSFPFNILFRCAIILYLASYTIRRSSSSPYPQLVSIHVPSNYNIKCIQFINNIRNKYLPLDIWWLRWMRHLGPKLDRL